MIFFIFVLFELNYNNANCPLTYFKMIFSFHNSIQKEKKHFFKSQF